VCRSAAPSQLTAAAAAATNGRAERRTATARWLAYTTVMPCRSAWWCTDIRRSFHRNPVTTASRWTVSPLSYKGHYSKPDRLIVNCALSSVDEHVSSAPASNATVRQRCPRTGLCVRQYGVIGRLVCSAGAPTGCRRVETRASGICRDVRPRPCNAVAVSYIVDSATLTSCRFHPTTVMSLLCVCGKLLLILTALLFHWCLGLLIYCFI